MTREYSSKIIKAGALLGDTRTLLLNWDSQASVAENLDRIRRDNVFGKASRSRVGDILAIFRQRYLVEESVARALKLLIHGKLPPLALERILYFHAACADRLLFESVTEILVPMREQGLTDIHAPEFQKSLRAFLRSRQVAPWSEATLVRVVRSLLATLRDFGVLQGKARKRIAPLFVPVQAFAYVVFYLKQRQPSGFKLLERPEWRLFFLSKEDVERRLFEAHQCSLLEYHAAGSVTRLTFPADTLEEYANVLAQR